ncbi:MAG TPA: nucleotidyltransferase family protein [Longimicrobiales bacterium]|nr:nucleotidyltransferase family protein [Longimicrobiales bacterium]
MSPPDTPASRRTAVSAVLLAAGASRRFGSQKLLAPLDGVPLVRIAAEHLLAAPLLELVVVVGREAAAVCAALAGLPVRFAPNRRWSAGLSGSLRVGMRAVAAGADAALVALGDQPAVTPEVVGRLVAAYRAGSAPIVAPDYAGVRGNPVVFDRSVFPELLRLRGDVGARRIVAADPARVERVRFEFPPPPDVDTPAEYARLLLERR